MTSAYNPFLVAKMLDRAGHSCTPDWEALVAVRKANEHCSSRGKTIGDVVRFVDGDIYAAAADMRHADLLSEIAELTTARDHAEARVRAQAETLAELRRARAEDALIIDGLRAEIRALSEKLNTQAVAVSPIEPILAMVDEAPVVDDPVIELARADVSEFDGDRVDRDLMSEPCEFDPVTSSAQCNTSPPREAQTAALTQFERARFILLASLGHAGSSIARRLSREFGRTISVACVTELLRQRWRSPRFRGLVDAAAAARRDFASRNRAALPRNVVPNWSHCA